MNEKEKELLQRLKKALEYATELESKLIELENAIQAQFEYINIEDIRFESEVKNEFVVVYMQVQEDDFRYSLKIDKACKNSDILYVEQSFYNIIESRDKRELTQEEKNILSRNIFKELDKKGE